MSTLELIFCSTSACTCGLYNTLALTSCFRHHLHVLVPMPSVHMVQQISWVRSKVDHHTAQGCCCAYFTNACLPTGDACLNPLFHLCKAALQRCFENIKFLSESMLHQRHHVLLSYLRINQFS